MLRPWLFGACLVAGLALGPAGASAHRDPCHLHHTCPSDHHTYAWRGLLCTSYADERLAADTRTVVYLGRTYWCHAATAAAGPTGPGPSSSEAATVRASRTRTPGVRNPAVTQATIHRTVCVPGWTSRIRPPASYTSALKLRQMRQYGEKGLPSAYEEDHLISLELGGHPTDPRNLWPEPIARARADDSVENRLHAALCAGTLTLAQAQSRIAELKHTRG
jgi:hypothetical protein